MLFSLVVLGLVIGANNLAVALALGALGQAHRAARIIAVFGVFEFVVPFLGMWLGAYAAQRLLDRSEWLGPLLLAAVGTWAVAAALRERIDAGKLAALVTSWRGVIVLALSLSVDNLLVGFSLGLQRISPLAVAATIAVFSMGFTWLGLRLGNVSRRRWELHAQWTAGALLIVLAALMYLNVI
jgi:manganese efflux pump family protein